MRFEPRPTPEMVGQHNISHISFRSWCPFCVRGRGTTFRHQHVTGKDEEQLPTISVDYEFIGNPETRADQLPIMVIKDRASRGIWAHPVPSKGLVDPYGWKRLVSTLDEMGYRRIILKSDQERSMRAVCMEAKRGFKGDLVLEKAPVEGHERSNGEVERAV